MLISLDSLDAASHEKDKIMSKLILGDTFLGEDASSSEVVEMYCKEFGVEQNKEFIDLFELAMNTGVRTFVVHHTNDVFTKYIVPYKTDKKFDMVSSLNPRDYTRLEVPESQLLTNFTRRLTKSSVDTLTSCMLALAIIQTNEYREGVITEAERQLRNGLFFGLFKKFPDIGYMAVRLLPEKTIFLIQTTPTAERVFS